MWGLVDGLSGCVRVLGLMQQGRVFSVSLAFWVSCRGQFMSERFFQRRSCMDQRKRRYCIRRNFAIIGPVADFLHRPLSGYFILAGTHRLVGHHVSREVVKVCAKSFTAVLCFTVRTEEITRRRVSAWCRGRCNPNPNPDPISRGRDCGCRALCLL